MPLFYQQNINVTTKLAIWKIEETEDFFLQNVSLLQKINHPHKRLQHLAGRYLLKFLFPNFPNNEIIIADTNKPFLLNEQYHFSISHCGNYAAAIAGTNKRVGIDIELPSQKIENIVTKFLNKEELLQFFPSIINKQLLTVLWCAKEAVFKWWSYGSVDFKNQIHLQYFDLATNGLINASFNKDLQLFHLQLHYILFNELCLVWLSDELLEGVQECDAT